jgi:hypothetical protein
MNKSAPASHQVVDDLHDAVRQLAKEFLATRSPWFAWAAIRRCIKHKREFPDWVIDYLGGCADRMQSERVRRTSDTRNELPWVFGIKGGLDQNSELLREWAERAFALKFALLVGKGNHPVDARRDAAIDIYGKAEDAFGDEVFRKLFVRRNRKKRKIAGDEYNGLDDKTLERILKRQFQLKNLRLTPEQWIDVIGDVRRLFMRLSDSTKFTGFMIETPSGQHFPVKLESH